MAGSLRTDSCNKKLARAVMNLAGDGDNEFIDIRDYNIPLYDGDIEASSGIPAGVSALGKKISAADAIVIATPEYNSSIPAVLKNVIDWLSREKPVSMAGKNLLLIAASPGALGGVRVLWHCRQPFEAIGVHVFPGTMGLADAYNAFDENGAIKDAKTAARFKDLLEQFKKYVCS